MTLPEFDNAAAKLEARLDRWPAPAWLGGAVFAALLLSIFFFSPKLQLWDFAIEGSYETTRARTFLQQCADPFDPVSDRAMQWRLLPPLVCHALHLGPRLSLAFPWAGVAFFLGSAAVIFQRHGLTRLQAALATAFVATTSAVIVPIMWLGVNDAWVWVALLWVSFGRSRSSLVAACLLAPWIDERFLIGFPLAFSLRMLLERRLEKPGGVLPLVRGLLLAGLALLPYVATRLFVSAQTGDEQSRSFLASVLTGFVTWVPFAPLGWWMAFRAGWLPILYAAFSFRREAWGVVPALGAASLAIMVVLASDLSRSAAIVLPLLAAGLILAHRQQQRWTTRSLALLLVANLALPALHVVYTKVDVISPFPLELYRLFR